MPPSLPSSPPSASPTACVHSDSPAAANPFLPTTAVTSTTSAAIVPSQSPARPAPSPAETIHQLRSELLAARRAKVQVERALRHAQAAQQRGHRRDP
eukprot:276450-Pleurochrysis_carterae.AAC.1